MYILIAVPIVAARQVIGPPQTVSNAGTPAAAETQVPQPRVEEEVVSGKPARLIIPRLKIDLAVENGEYHRATNTWTLSDVNAHYALMTPEPSNQAGNTLIYGHNTRRVLAATKDIKQGDTLVVKTDNEHTFTYTYTGDNIVNPTDTEFLGKPAGVPTLTLLTCDGPWFEKRRLMSFALQEAE